MTVVTTEVDPDEPSAPLETVQDKKQYPMKSLMAAAQRLNSTKIKGMGRANKAEAWQQDAWDMYNLVGEQRFLSDTRANRIAQARFFVGKMPKNPTEEIEVVTEGPAYDVFESMRGKGAHFSQMIKRLAINLGVPGDGYIAGLPKDGPVKKDGTISKLVNGISPFGGKKDEDDLEGIVLEDLRWRMISISEIQFDKTGEVKIRDEDDKWVEWNADDIILIRVWNPHPERFSQADSPVRSNLPVLRELVGLTMKISANIDSRLAGAGILWIPTEIDQAVRAAAGATGEDDLSPLAEAVMDAMITPISDRSNASSVVPLMPVVPGDWIEKIRYDDFAKLATSEDRQDREEAIRRMALGEDCPPELLLGVGNMNHWGAWLVKEDVVTTHLEPPLALMCDAMTSQFFWPVLEQQNLDDFEDYVIWYDVTHLIVKPDKSDDALAVFNAGELSGESLRDATGFGEDDAPPADPTDPVTKLVLDLVKGAPTLMQNPGLDVIAAQIKALVDGGTIPETPAQETPAEEVPAVQEGEEPEPNTEGGVPSTQNDSGEPENA